MVAKATPENRTTNTAASRGIRATSRTASRGRREPVTSLLERTRRVRVVTIMDRAAMIVVAAVVVVVDGACTRVRAVG